MLIQLLLDYFSEGVGLLVGLIPPLPPEIDSAMSDVAEGMDWLGDQVFVLGILVPFDAVEIVVNVWLSTLALWAGAVFTGLILRIIRG